MSSKVERCNLALSHIGISNEIATITEKSESARACNRFFDISEDETLRDFSWPFATKFETLSLIEECPNKDWGFSYSYPADCIRAHKILSGIRNDNRQTRISYELAQRSEGTIIFTDMKDAELKYTAKITNQGIYPPDYIMAHSFLLAFYIAPRVTNSDQFGLGQRAIAAYQSSIDKARSTAFNEQQDDEDPDAEWIRSRSDIDPRRPYVQR